jgi:competence protein ComEC
MLLHRVPIWKRAPFIRLFVPLAAGIVIQFYTGLTFHLIIPGIVCFSTAFFLFYLFPAGIRYKLRSVQGFILELIIAVCGMYIAWQKDIRNDPQWFGHSYDDSMHLVIRIDEPPVSKSKSYKAEGIVTAIVSDDTIYPKKGKLFLYFAKDSTGASIQYGTQILLRKPLQQIKNTGNPAAFDFKRYAAFQQISHNIYLEEKDYVILADKDVHPFWRFIYSSRSYIITVLRQYTGDDKNITGVAEALLIGYKEDLDKDLVQAYSNTGVVHIIAISGLHLGLIYFVLSWIFARLPYLKKHRLMRIVLILASLWLFAILTGSSASVLRSAVMFTCILFGKSYFKGSSIYNALAASAFMLLCYNPWFLWDVGFQLSYLAVTGIVWIQQPLYRLIYIKNKWLNKIWNMASVTIAAQLAAFPLCIYYFHQFPNLFLITNLLIVPLSTLILFAEILLIILSGVNIAAMYAGRIIGFLIDMMNAIVRVCNEFPFSMIDDIYSNAASTWLLYGIVVFAAAWILYKSKAAMKLSLCCLLSFCFIHTVARMYHSKQKKIIVYNVPGMSGMDMVDGLSFSFIGDSALSIPGSLRNFHVRPARIAMQAATSNSVDQAVAANNIFSFAGKRILIIHDTLSLAEVSLKIPVDLLVISGNAIFTFSNLLSAIQPALVVFDSSNSLWKIARWKKECSALLLRFHSVPEQGAFVHQIN